MHDPEGYFPRRFLNDFDTFWQALDEIGSASPGRGPGEESFSAEDFALREDGTDLLANIHKGRRIPFMYGMMFSVLMDQLLYTHFGSMYGSWTVSPFLHGHRLGLKSHPKMHFDEKETPCHEMERPWLIFSQENLKSRTWKPTDIIFGFRPYADAMIGLWGRAIDRGMLPGLDWGMIQEALRHDPHVKLSPFGIGICDAAWLRQSPKKGAA